VSGTRGGNLLSPAQTTFLYLLPTTASTTNNSVNNDVIDNHGDDDDVATTASASSDKALNNQPLSMVLKRLYQKENGDNITLSYNDIVIKTQLQRHCH
jgi:hypothetical protein